MICWLSCSFHLTLQLVIDSHLTERREMFIYHTNLYLAEKDEVG